MSARGLGRGFEALIPTGINDEFDPTAKEDGKLSKLTELKLTEVYPDEDQPRRNFSQTQLLALAESIREHGVLQPIVVTKEGTNRYKIVAGERRWRASKLAQRETIPAIIRTLNSQNRLELSLIENVQREDLNAIETATAYMKLKEQFNLSSAEIAKRIGKSNTAVINTMRLLNLPDKVKHAMVEHGLTEGQMRPLIMATPEQIDAVLPRIISEHWSAHRVEQYMNDLKAALKRKEAAPVDDFKNSEKSDRLSVKLGTKVRVRTNSKGAGDIVIKFKSEEEYNKICSILMN